MTSIPVIASLSTLFITLPEDGVDLQALTLQIEKQLIVQAIERSKKFGPKKGLPNYTIAAEFLGITRTSLVEKRRRHGLLLDAVN